MSTGSVNNLFLSTMRYAIGILFWICCMHPPALAQDSLGYNQPLIRLSYGADQPVGLLADRFGTNFRLGVEVGYITRSNITFGLSYQFRFGSNVQEDVLEQLRTPGGFVIGSNMQFSSVLLRERGHQIMGTMGYLFPFSGSTNRRGFLLELGAGYLEHRIRFVDESDAVVQLAGDFVKGYDRLTAGPSLTQRLGYLFMGDDRLLNFYFGLSATEAFTKSVRKFNYDTGLPDTDRRTDIFLGAEVTWLIPIGGGSRTIYY